jgi:hypothetical protein
MQAGTSEVKSSFCRRLPLASGAKLLGIRGLRRSDGVAARGTRQELRNSDKERTGWSLVAFFSPA